MPDRQLFLLATTTAQYVGRIVVRQVEPVGIPAYLLALLTHVRDHAPVTPSTISEVSGVPMTTLRDNIQRLVDRRLIRRRGHPHDGRSYLLVMTRKGEAVTEAAGEALLDAYLELERQLRRPLVEYERVLEELNEALRLVLGEEPEEAGTAPGTVARRPAARS